MNREKRLLCFSFQKTIRDIQLVRKQTFDESYKMSGKAEEERGTLASKVSYRSCAKARITRQYGSENGFVGYSSVRAGKIVCFTKNFILALYVVLYFMF